MIFSDISRLSIENVVFDISPEGALLKANSVETHKMYLTAQPDVGTFVESIFTLQHTEVTSEYVEQLEFETLEEAVNSTLEWYREFDLEADVDGAISEFGEVTVSWFELKLYLASFSQWNTAIDQMEFFFQNEK